VSVTQLLTTIVNSQQFSVCIRLPVCLNARDWTNVCTVQINILANLIDGVILFLITFKSFYMRICSCTLYDYVQNKIVNVVYWQHSEYCVVSF